MSTSSSAFDTRRASIRRQMETMRASSSNRSNGSSGNGSPTRRRGSKSPKPLRGTRSPGLSQLNMESARRFLYEDEDTTPNNTIMNTPPMSNRASDADQHQQSHTFFETATADNGRSQNLWSNYRKGSAHGDGLFVIGKSSRSHTSHDHDEHSTTYYRPSILTNLYVQARCQLADSALRIQAYRYGIRSRYEMVMANGRGKKCCLALFVFLLVLIPSVILISKAGGESAARAAVLQRYEAISNRIVESGISLQEDLMNHNSPQYQALEWIAHGDPAQLDTMDQFLLQRYSLAVFYYATHGDHMYQTTVINLSNRTTADREQDEEEPEADEVIGDETKQLEPEDMPDDGSAGDDFAASPTWLKEDRWLTGHGICSWYGVACHHRRHTPVQDTVYDENNGLAFFNMTQNNVRGAVPRELFLANRGIRWMSLDSNGFFKSLPTEIGLMTNLRYLTLANNFFAGTLPSDMAKLTALDRLYLDGNNFEGSLPISFGQLSHLLSLSLYNTFLTGTIPDLSSIKNLTSLYLDINYLTGTIPTSLGSLTKLVDLRLRQNLLGGTIPSELSKLTSAEVIYLDRNELTGSIPSQLGLLGKRLEELHLYRNQLTGSLPSELAKLRTAASLYFDNNKLTGSIPTEFGTMNDLETLYLQRNRLSGPLPSEIGGMLNLQNFRVYTNGMTGTIPTEIAKAWKLADLYLQDNLFQGTLPTEVAELTRLERFRLYWNDVTGVVPQKVCELTDYKLVEFKVDCAGREPQLTCPCCTHCYS